MRYLVFALVLSLPVLAHGDLINEFEPNPSGSDPAQQSVEITGTPNAAFDLWFLAIEGEGTTTPGLIDDGANITGTYDANGFASVSFSDFENPTMTYILTDTFTGTINTTDVDTNNDGTIDDFSFWGTVMDAVGVTDGAGSTVDFLYGTQLGGTDLVVVPNSAFTGDEPEIIFREGNTGDWYMVNNGEVFDAGGTKFANTAPPWTLDPTLTTFGSVNPSIPEPAGTTALLALGAIAFLKRRRI